MSRDSLWEYAVRRTVKTDDVFERIFTDPPFPVKYLEGGYGDEHTTVFVLWANKTKARRLTAQFDALLRGRGSLRKMEAT